ncbi:MAG: hypothetical protein AAF487_15120 [Bacteroidota bacterium]
MKKINLFGFGTKADKRNATVLPENLASLFGAEEGEELIVEASEKGVEAIHAAESHLIEANALFAAAQADVDTLEKTAISLKEANTKVFNLENENAELRDQCVRLEEKPATNHTTVDKQKDEAHSESAKKFAFELEEERVQSESEEINEKYNL